MIRNWKTLPAALALCLASATAYAEDVVSTPNDVSSSTDATATTDTAGGDTGTTDTGGGGFTPNPCWEEKCVKEVTACKANANCVKFAACKDQACQEAIAKADEAAVTLYNAIANCGYKACNDPTKGTCVDKCGKFLGDTAPCNCDDQCKDFGDCCADYDKVCAKVAPKGSCKDSCGGQSGDGECYCDDQCAKMGDCCTDIDTFCKGQTGGDGGGSVGADTSSCTPVCTGKNCGDDDKCGGKCSGPCPTGGACDMATKTCKTGGADASTTGGSDAGATDSGVKSDTAGNTGTTGTTGTATTSSSSGGCTANGSSNGSLGMAFGLLALMGLVVRRRRA
jgi:MYXO-CTERM domain-containing protein